MDLKMWKAESWPFKDDLPLILGTCEYDIFCSKQDFVDLVTVKHHDTER